MTGKHIQMHEHWLQWLQPEFDQPYMQELRAFLQQEKAQKKTIYPHSSEVFSALDSLAPEQVKVVILGQDPYHGPNQAHGLSFSVKPGVALPPSLRNIFQEIEQDLGISMSGTGYLKPWADQGVLLLNSVLTVEQGQAGSHQGRGWERFTDRIISLLNERCEHVVFMLWGAYAQKKAKSLDGDRHLILKAPHPSPLSAYRGFFGCGHFSSANAYLSRKGVEPIDWRL